jgi:hypothetical protein
MLGIKIDPPAWQGVEGHPMYRLIRQVLGLCEQGEPEDIPLLGRNSLEGRRNMRPAESATRKDLSEYPLTEEEKERPRERS